MAVDWETRLRSWSGRSSDTEDDKREWTERAIREAIAASPRLRDKSINVFAKGSYKNNTNVRADSDVDIAVEYSSAIFSDYQHRAAGLTREHYGVGEYSLPYPWASLKDDVEQAMVSRFGRAAVTRGNKAI